MVKNSFGGGGVVGVITMDNDFMCSHITIKLINIVLITAMHIMHALFPCSSLKLINYFIHQHCKRYNCNNSTSNVISKAIM